MRRRYTDEQIRGFCQAKENADGAYVARLTDDEAARAAGASRALFQRWRRRCVPPIAAAGVSVPVEGWVEAALQALAGDAESVEQIGARLGFVSCSAFEVACKAATGFTPRQIRRKV